MSNAAPGWYPDPSGRHHQRYWDGVSWTDHVADHGQAAVDLPVPPPPPMAVPPPPSAAPVPPAPVPRAPAPPAPVPPAPVPSAPIPPPLTPTSPAPAAAPSSTRPFAVATLVGAAIAGVGLALDWVKVKDFSARAFDVPAAYLLDYSTSAKDDFNVGLLVVALVALTVVAALVKGGSRRTLGRVAGSGLVLVGLAFVFQLNRAIGDTALSLTDALGAGPIAVIAGGAVVVAARGK